MDFDFSLLSSVPEDYMATVRKAVSNILQCLLANTGTTNRTIFFKVLEAVEQGQRFLTFADKELCLQLVEEAYGSKSPKTEPTVKTHTEEKEGGADEGTSPKGNKEEDVKETPSERNEVEGVEEAIPKEEEPEEGTPKETVPQETTPEGNEEEGVKTAPVETAPERKEGGDVEETVLEETSPKPQEVAGAKKLFAKLSSGLTKEASTVPPSVQDATLLLDAQFWGEPLTAASAVSMCIDMVGFDAVRGGTVEELSTSLLASPGSAEKGANLTDMHCK